MAEGRQTLFRQKNVDSIESPESLNDYLKVTSPGIWLFLLGVALLLCGVVIWGIFGRINTTVSVSVVSENGSSYCIVPFESASAILEQKIVTVGDNVYELTGAIAGADVITEDTGYQIRLAGNFNIGDVYAILPLTTALSNGVQKGTVVTESLQPISLLLR